MERLTLRAGDRVLIKQSWFGDWASVENSDAQKAIDRLAELEDKLESGQLVEVEDVKARCKTCPGLGLMAAHGNPKE